MINDGDGYWLMNQWCYGLSMIQYDPIVMVDTMIDHGIHSDAIMDAREWIVIYWWLRVINAPPAMELTIGVVMQIIIHLLLTVRYTLNFNGLYNQFECDEQWYKYWDPQCEWIFNALK